MCFVGGRPSAFLKLNQVEKGLYHLSISMVRCFVIETKCSSCIPYGISIIEVLTFACSFSPRLNHHCQHPIICHPFP